MEDGPSFKIRPAVPADEADWRRLWQAYCDFYRVIMKPGVTAHLWSRILDPGQPIHALVAEKRQGGSLDGFANYILHPFTWGMEDICYLEDLFVFEGARGRGMGRALIGSLTALARERGWPRVYWHTHELNEPARSLYEAITPRDPFVRYVVRTDGGRP